MKKLSVLLMVLALVGCSSNTAPVSKTGTGEVETDSDKTTVTVTLAVSYTHLTLPTNSLV